jgi:hypothetical protein
MAQAGTPTRFVNYFRGPDALIVTAAMLDRREHRAHEPTRLPCNYSGNPAHKNGK